MDYIELNIPVWSSEQSEIIMAELADYPFDSFTEQGNHLKAYIPQDLLADCKDDVDQMLSGYEIAGARYISIETKNWNAEWESNFSPVEVEDKILIRAPFHEPSSKFAQEVVIMPKMSFGTGHHSTTYLMSLKLSGLNLSGKRGLDMGSGTGVLAILAVKYGASSVDAIDIDEWAYENCCENLVQNGVSDQVTPLLGNASLLEGRAYDFVLANINCNILLADMPRYVATLPQGGVLLMSGFFVEDIPLLQDRAEELGMAYDGFVERDGWAVAEFHKM